MARLLLNKVANFSNSPEFLFKKSYLPVLVIYQKVVDAGLRPFDESQHVLTMITLTNISTELEIYNMYQ